jgi:chromosomal replication initiation ATPase DnaA
LENNNPPDYIKAKNFYIIEDIDKISAQKILLHIYNLINEQGAYLLLTSTVELNNIKYQTADLASRLKNIFSVHIKEPEINLIKMLLMKNFSAKQLAVEENVIDYLAANIERSFVAISQITKMLEFYCFEEKRKITIPLASRVIGLGEI